jgi:hypothetical protein
MAVVPFLYAFFRGMVIFWVVGVGAKEEMILIFSFALLRFFLVC